MGLTIEVIHNISFDLKSSNIQRLNFENLHCTYGWSQIFKKYHVSNLKHTQLQELNLASNRIHSLEFGVLSLFPKSLRVFNIANNVSSYGFYIMEFSSWTNWKYWMQASRILLIKLVSKNIFCNNAMIQGKPKHLVTIPEKWQTTKKNQYNRDDRKLITTPTSFHHIHPTTTTTKATKSSNNSDSHSIFT